ncbi:MAG: radical SAM protein [Candidatus Brocadiia bacterium]
MLFERAAELAKASVARRLGDLIAQASPESLARIWGLFEKVAASDSDKVQARRFRWLVESGHPFGGWLKRIATELNPKARSCLVRNLYGNAWFLSRGTRRDFREEHGYDPPYIIVFDVTSRCNLTCEGCWAAMYGKRRDFPIDLLDRAVTEAEEEMGIHFFVFSGGEPTLRDDLYEFYRDHGDSQFQVYTNGTLIDDAMAARFAECGNVMPMLSIEGDAVLTDDRRGDGIHDRVLKAMDHLRNHGVLFGFSATGTRKNVDSIMSDEFVERMIEKGCLYGWYFQYIPIGRNPNLDLMVTPEQREKMRVRVYELRNKYPIFLSDFWNDGTEVNGCMAGGKRYFHVNNNGDIEPCVFCHFAVHNVRDTTLTEALKHPLFRAIREGIPYDGNLLRPCMLIDRPKVFRAYAEKYGAEPTHPGAETLIEDLAEGLDRRAAAWAEIAEQKWDAGEQLPLYPYPPGEEPAHATRTAAARVDA